MRTFVAIEFDDEIKRRLGDLQTRLKTSCPKIKWVDPENMHLTIKFLGEIRNGQVAPIGKSLDRLAGECRAFDVTVEGLGAFGRHGPVKVVWVGLQDTAGHLAECHARCEELLDSLGFPPERRRFSPHLTLARNRYPEHSGLIRAVLDEEPPFKGGTQTVSGVTFYQSTLTPQGPIYTALSRHTFSP